MLAPYSDDPKNSGIPRRPDGEMIKMISERNAAGFQVGHHAIGDRAVRVALDGFSYRKVSYPTVGTTPPSNKSERWVDQRFAIRRNRIEHSQVVSPPDFERFARMGIIASMQPTHAITDKRWAPKRLGEYRTLGAYAWNTFKSYGVHVPFGTDSPVEPLNTYLTLYAAVSRQNEQGLPFGGWQPQEKLSMEEAIRSYTYESAYAEFSEKEKGMIKVGMLADLVVHSKDLLTIKHSEILTTRPVYTIFNGKIVYKK
jgi:predicted amidohydrolase YtcJ